MRAQLFMAVWTAEAAPCAGASMHVLSRRSGVHALQQVGLLLLPLHCSMIIAFFSREATVSLGCAPTASRSGREAGRHREHDSQQPPPK